MNRLVSLCRNILPGILLLGTAAPLPAAIREATDTLVDRRMERAIALLDTVRIGIPSSLTSDRDLLVFCTVGGAYGDLHALARPAVAPQKVARALERAAVGTTLALEPVEWSREEDYSAARLAWSHGRFGGRQSATAVPVGRITAGLRAAGFEPRIVLRVPRHAVTPSLPLPQDLSGQNYSWYNASHADRALIVTVRARLSSTAFAMSLAFFFFVPTVCLSSLLLAVMLGSWKRLPVEKRRSFYPKIAIWPTFVAIGLHAPTVIFYLRSPTCRALSDLWFGSGSITATMPLIMAPLPFLLLILPLSSVVERRLFGPSQAQQALTAATTAGERAARKRLAFWLLLPALLGFGVIMSGMLLSQRRGSGPQKFTFLLGIAVMYGGQALVKQRMRRETEAIERETEDPTLSGRVETLARQMGVQVKRIRVQDTPSGRLYASACMLPGARLLVSRKALEALTPEELDFLLAHELVHLKRKHLRTQFALIMTSALVMILPFMLLPLRLSGTLRFPSPTVLFVCGMSAFAWMFLGSRWMQKRMELESDRLALEATGSLAAAESALSKTMQLSPLPHLHEVDDLSTHPRLSRRLEALRAAWRATGRVS